jgi:hypothetical protein
MGAPSAYQGRILLAMIFLASPRMDLCSCCAAGFRNSTRSYSFAIGVLKDVEWLQPYMRQYRSTTNDMRKAIREIGFKSKKNLAAKGA